MKPPADIAARLARQWHQASLRVERLLSGDSWPLEFSIGKPTGAEFATRTVLVEAHVQRWRQVDIGEVVWEPVKYRAGAEAVPMPVYWRIHTPSQWAAASANAVVQKEFRDLEKLVGKVNEIYREVLIRDRSLWRNKDLDEVMATAELADSLQPGAAQGRPLRLLAGLGVDTKFFERNGSLLIRLLDERYQGAASEQGLHAFLDAHEENDHWVMLVPLERRLLPFRRQRVSTQELTEVMLPGSHVLVVENERCVHLLPELPGTVAILGAGLDLQWLQAAVFDGKSIAYWGDMDTWGLLMLARARGCRPEVVPLLMDRPVFDAYARESAVLEPVPAQDEPPAGLAADEVSFYLHLLGLGKGRLEQEYLPRHKVGQELASWRRAH
jgi:hypothetical protein